MLKKLLLEFPFSWKSKNESLVNLIPIDLDQGRIFLGGGSWVVNGLAWSPSSNVEKNQVWPPMIWIIDIWPLPRAGVRRGEAKGRPPPSDGREGTTGGSSSHVNSHLLVILSPINLGIKGVVQNLALKAPFSKILAKFWKNCFLETH